MGNANRNQILSFNRRKLGNVTHHTATISKASGLYQCEAWREGKGYRCQVKLKGVVLADAQDVHDINQARVWLRTKADNLHAEHVKLAGGEVVTPIHTPSSGAIAISEGLYNAPRKSPPIQSVQPKPQPQPVVPAAPKQSSLLKQSWSWQGELNGSKVGVQYEQGADVVTVTGGAVMSLNASELDTFILVLMEMQEQLIKGVQA